MTSSNRATSSLANVPIGQIDYLKKLLSDSISSPGEDDAVLHEMVELLCDEIKEEDPARRRKLLGERGM